MYSVNGRVIRLTKPPIMDIDIFPRAAMFDISDSDSAAISNGS